jgi:hypothetical protein
MFVFPDCDILYHNNKLLVPEPGFRIRVLKRKKIRELPNSYNELHSSLPGANLSKKKKSPLINHKLCTSTRPTTPSHCVNVSNNGLSSSSDPLKNKSKNRTPLRSAVWLGEQNQPLVQGGEDGVCVTAVIVTTRNSPTGVDVHHYLVLTLYILRELTLDTDKLSRFPAELFHSNSFKTRKAC